jgi:hypothetical protein
VPVALNTSNIAAISYMPELIGLPSSSPSNGTSNSSTLSTGAIAGIAVGGGVAVSIDLGFQI